MRRFVLLVLSGLSVLLAACSSDAPDLASAPEWARGGKIALSTGDSIWLGLRGLDRDTTALFVPADTFVESDPGERWQLVVTYWIQGNAYWKSASDGLLYRADFDRLCLRDRPKPIADNVGPIGAWIGDDSLNTTELVGVPWPVCVR